jgi:hydrogenase maturation protease
MKTLVIGLGNPILGDDGVGWKVAEEVERLCPTSPVAPDIEVDYLSLGGLSLMERLIGSDRAIIIDAISLEGAREGQVVVFSLDELPDRSAGHITAAHDTSLPTAIAVGRSMGAHLPDEVMVVGIQAYNLFEFSEELSPPIAAAVPEAAQRVMRLLENGTRLPSG